MRIILPMLVLAAPVAAMAQSDAQRPEYEIGYDRGALAYEALMSQQNRQAIALLARQQDALRNDPAYQLNLGRAYLRTGDLEKAQAAFQAALDVRDDVTLVLSNGRELSSKKAARIALAEVKALKKKRQALTSN